MDDKILPAYASVPGIEEEGRIYDLSVDLDDAGNGTVSFVDGEEGTEVTQKYEAGEMKERVTRGWTGDGFEYVTSTERFEGGKAIGTTVVSEDEGNGFFRVTVDGKEQEPSVTRGVETDKYGRAVEVEKTCDGRELTVKRVTLGEDGRPTSETSTTTDSYGETIRESRADWTDGVRGDVTTDERDPYDDGMTRVVSDGATGRVLSETRFEPDGRGGLERGERTTYGYDDEGNLESKTVVSPSGPLGVTTTKYDADGVMVERSGSRGDGSGHRVDVAEKYEDGRLSETVETKYFLTGDVTGMGDRYVHKTVETTKGPDGAVVREKTTTFDEPGDRVSGTVEKEFDADGRLTKETTVGADGETTVETYGRDEDGVASDDARGGEGKASADEGAPEDERDGSADRGDDGGADARDETGFEIADADDAAYLGDMGAPVEADPEEADGEEAGDGADDDADDGRPDAVDADGKSPDAPDGIGDGETDDAASGDGVSDEVKADLYVGLEDAFERYLDGDADEREVDDILGYVEEEFGSGDGEGVADDVKDVISDALGDAVVASTAKDGGADAPSTPLSGRIGALVDKVKEFVSDRIDKIADAIESKLGEIKGFLYGAAIAAAVVATVADPSFSVDREINVTDSTVHQKVEVSFDKESGTFEATAQGRTVLEGMSAEPSIWKEGATSKAEVSGSLDADGAFRGEGREREDGVREGPGSGYARESTASNSEFEGRVEYDEDGAIASISMEVITFVKSFDSTIGPDEARDRDDSLGMNVILDREDVETAPRDAADGGEDADDESFDVDDSASVDRED